MNETYDFAGWATRNDLVCSDGRIIGRDAFKECDGKVVPLVWNHQHSAISNVLGHALLKNDPDGVIAYGVFNDSKEGQAAKIRVQNGDITSLSIYANQLKQDGARVMHGAIREVSLVLAGANPGAFIEDVMEHSEGEDMQSIIYTGEDIVTSAEEPVDNTEDEIAHAEESAPKPAEEPAKEKTIGEVFDAMSEEKKQVVYAMVGIALENAKGEN
jgi:HK97 family phage prohead protease